MSPDDSPDDILFYSDFPFGYHNPEAEERMRRFAARGWRVRYVEQVGIRNPRPRHLLRIVRALRGTPAGGSEPPFPVVSPKLLPPRRAPGVAALNRWWLGRQLLAGDLDPSRTVLWLRYPTPELVPLVEGHRWRAVVYESVDDHLLTPGMNDRLRHLFRAAEQRVLRVADVVFASSAPLAERLGRAHPRVIRAPAAAVDLAALGGATQGVEPQPRLAVFTGALDHRFDADLVADVARRLAGWRLVLAGPALDAGHLRLQEVANVDLPGRVPIGEAHRLIARASVCLMPYRVGPLADTLFPVKLVEYLAAGRPVVSVPLRALETFQDVVAVGADAAAFAAAVAQTATDDDPEARERRRRLARPYDWEARIDQMEQAILDVPRRG